MLGPLQTRSVAPEALSEDDLGDWRALAERAVEPNPFCEPGLVRPALEFLAEPGVSLLVVHDDEHWRACLPVCPGKLGGVAPALRTWIHNYSYVGTPLLDRSDPVAAARALLELAADVAPGSRVKLEQVVVGGPAEAALLRAREDLGLKELSGERFERAFLTRRDDGDYFAGLRSRQRSELNRQARRLAEELGGDLALRDLGRDDAAVDRFLELERLGWKGREGTAIASTEDHVSFFRAVCRNLAAENRLQLLAYGTPERTVAMAVNFRAGEGLFGFKMAHDEELNRFSPGMLLLRESALLFDEDESLRWIDPCTTPESAVNRIWPDRRVTWSDVLAPSGAWARVQRLAIRTVR